MDKLSQRNQKFLSEYLDNASINYAVLNPRVEKLSSTNHYKPHMLGQGDELARYFPQPLPNRLAPRVLLTNLLADSVQSLLDILVDGGNTEVLATEVQTAFPPERYQFFQKKCILPQFCQQIEIDCQIPKVALNFLYLLRADGIQFVIGLLAQCMNTASITEQTDNGHGNKR